MNWQCGRFVFTFPRPTLLMGVVNVTPDSFADGGRYFTVDAAVQHGLELVAEGADLLDVGGESTRPDATPVDAAEELRRVLPVIKQLAGRVPVPVSIDTQKPVVAEAALAAGASVVNDIAAHRVEDRMWRLVAESGAGYVCMHMQGTPQTMQRNPQYEDVVGEVTRFFATQRERIGAAGVRVEQIVFDPGIGFGKTLEHNLELLARLGSFRRLTRPLLLGASRKSFLGRLLGVGVDARLPGSLACASWAVAAGVEIIRTHDVAATRQTVAVIEALNARHKSR